MPLPITPLPCCLAWRASSHRPSLHAHTGGWSQQWGHDVHGKTLALASSAAAGSAQPLPGWAAEFNMRLLAYDPIPNETAQDLGVEFVPLETLLQQSDYVSLHAAVTRKPKA